MKINKGDRYRFTTGGDLAWEWEVLSIIENKNTPLRGVLFKKVKRDKGYKFCVAVPSIHWYGRSLNITWIVKYIGNTIETLQRIGNFYEDKWETTDDLKIKDEDDLNQD